MPAATPIILALGLGLVGWLVARSRAWAFRRGREGRLHSLPAYHGWFVAICVVVPALLFALVWSNIAPSLALGDALKTPVGTELPAFGLERDSIVAEARSLASGQTTAAFNPLAQKLAVPLGEARAKMGPEPFLLGNLDPVRELRNGTPDMIRAAIAECHRQGGPRYIIGAGCEVPRDTPPANVRALLEYARTAS